MTPSACPVVTGPCALERKSNVSPPSTGRPSSSSAKTSRRLAASAAPNCTSPSRSASAGRVRVSAQLAHSPAGPASPWQPIRPRFAHGSPASSPRIVRSSQSNPSAVPQWRQSVLSKVTRCRHTGHVKARIARR